MAYGLNPRLFVENGPANRSAEHRARSLPAYRGWRALTAERRLALVDRTLGRAANDNLGDGYPAAL